MFKTEIEGMQALLDRIDLVSEETIEATTLGMLEAADDAVFAMEARIDEAVTYTGSLRHAKTGRNPGRVETGKMISSLRQSDGTPAVMKFNSSGSLTMEVGYFNDPPPYTHDQEFNKYSGGLLLATQAAYGVLSEDAQHYVAARLNELIEQSAKGNYSPKAPTFGPQRHT